MKPCPKCSEALPDYADTCPYCAIDLETMESVPGLVEQKKVESRKESDNTIYKEIMITSVAFSMACAIFRLAEPLETPFWKAPIEMLQIGMIAGVSIGVAFVIIWWFFSMLGAIEEQEGRKIWKVIKGEMRIIITLVLISNILLIISLPVIPKIVDSIGKNTVVVQDSLGMVRAAFRRIGWHLAPVGYFFLLALRVLRRKNN